MQLCKVVSNTLVIDHHLIEKVNQDCLTLYFYEEASDLMQQQIRPIFKLIVHIASRKLYFLIMETLDYAQIGRYLVSRRFFGNDASNETRLHAVSAQLTT